MGVVPILSIILSIIFVTYSTYNHSLVEIFVDWSFPKKTNKKEKAEPLLALP